MRPSVLNANTAVEVFTSFTEQRFPLGWRALVDLLSGYLQCAAIGHAVPLMVDDERNFNYLPTSRNDSKLHVFPDSD